MAAACWLRRLTYGAKVVAKFDACMSIFEFDILSRQVYIYRLQQVYKTSIMLRGKEVKESAAEDMQSPVKSMNGAERRVGSRLVGSVIAEQQISV